MKLSNLALLVLRGSKDMRDQICAMEKCHMVTVNRWVRNQDSNLTKAAIIDIIRKGTGMADDQILEETEPEMIN